MARLTAFSDSWHAAATSRIERRCQPGPGGGSVVGPAPPVQVVRGVAALIGSEYHIRYTYKQRYTVVVRSDVIKSAALLREARLRANLTQEALAVRTGKTRPQIARWEAGTIGPSLETLLELIRACDFDLPLELTPRERLPDEHLKTLQQLSPERRLDEMLHRSSAQDR
jgi:transcriptional regulator with XRE-family HTH domain